MPDLTNQIVGILPRFREGRVAFMEDIEAMFYQVRVPEEHRSLSRFLWCKDNNTSSDIVDYEMNAHVFCGTLSPSCNSYALRHTAADNGDKFGKEAAVTQLLWKRTTMLMICSNQSVQSRMQHQ